MCKKLWDLIKEKQRIDRIKTALEFEIDSLN